MTNTYPCFCSLTELATACFKMETRRQIPSSITRQVFFCLNQLYDGSPRVFDLKNKRKNRFCGVSQVLATYGGAGRFPSVRIHAGHQMDPGRVDQPRDGLISGQVFVAQVVGQFEQHFATHHLVAVHVGHVFELGLHCNTTVMLQLCNYAGIRVGHFWCPYATSGNALQTRKSFFFVPQKTRLLSWNSDIRKRM